MSKSINVSNIILKMQQEELYEVEIKKCMSRYRTHGGCSFNNSSSCNECGAIPLLLKMMYGKLDHRPIRELEKDYKILK